MKRYCAITTRVKHVHDRSGLARLHLKRPHKLSVKRRRLKARSIKRPLAAVSFMQEQASVLYALLIGCDSAEQRFEPCIWVENRPQHVFSQLGTSPISQSQQLIALSLHQDAFSAMHIQSCHLCSGGLCARFVVASGRAPTRHIANEVLAYPSKLLRSEARLAESWTSQHLADSIHEPA